MSLSYRARKFGPYMTKAEFDLRHALEREGINFITHEPIRTENGCFNVDFLIGHNLVVEVDGSSHIGKTAERKDAWKNMELMNAGFRVLRFTNHEVYKKLDWVVKKIRQKLRHDS